MNIAKTTLSSKILTGDKEHFANLAVDAIMRLKGVCGGGKGGGDAECKLVLMDNGFVYLGRCVCGDSVWC